MTSGSVSLRSSQIERKKVSVLHDGSIDAGILKSLAIIEKQRFISGRLQDVNANVF